MERLALVARRKTNEIDALFGRRRRGWPGRRVTRDVTSAADPFRQIKVRG